MPKKNPIDTESLFIRADQQWEKGSLRSAFCLFLAGAKAGDSFCQGNLGYFYSEGIGVKPNRDLALYWWRRAYRAGERGAASNIGTVFRDEKKLGLALRWFEKAVSLDDGDANLEIAKIYLNQKQDPATAVRYLRATLKAPPTDVTIAAKEEAEQLLRKLLKAKKRVR